MRAIICLLTSISILPFLTNCVFATPQNFYQTAIAAIQTGIKTCHNLGIACGIAITNRSGTLVALSKMPQAVPQTPQVAISKASTSASTGISTSNLAAYSQPGKPFYTIANLHYQGQQFLLLPGGEPLNTTKTLYGGVGVASSVIEHKKPYWIGEDAHVAKTVRKAFLDLLKHPKQVAKIISHIKKESHYNDILTQAIFYGQKLCAQQKIACSISITDAHGEVIAAGKMDSDLPIDMFLSNTKAFSAGSIGLPTAKIQKNAQPGRILHNFMHYDLFHSYQISAIPGGQPIFIDGKLKGAVGVASSHGGLQLNAFASNDAKIAANISSYIEKALTHKPH